jgi:hypothetical protein
VKGHVSHARIRLALLGSLGVTLCCLSACSAPKDAAPLDGAAPSAGSSHSADQGLTARIGYNHTLDVFRVENRDSFAWSNCQFNLNAHGFATGYTLEVDVIRPGLTEAALLHAADFTDSKARRFDPATEKVATLDFGCDSPQGRLYYGGQYRPGQPGN